MEDIRITNCHIHTFTNAHVPKWYPSPLLYPFKVFPGLGRAASQLVGLFGQEDLSETLERISRFQSIGDKRKQQYIFESLLKLYPSNTRFVVLPMEMAHMGYGTVEKGLRAQHDELAQLAERFPDQVIPFATCDPNSAESVDEAMRAIETLGFRGLKIYPRIGFPPDHTRLMDTVYPLLVQKNLPVMSHCSRGGVQGKALTEAKANAYTDPHAVLPVLQDFPDLRLCLAHFGGQRDWSQYVNEGVARGKRAQNWLTSILDLLTSGDYPGLWTDISYTIFRFEDYIPFLQIFLEDPTIRSRVLFGSDYYMTKQERLSERSISFRLRVALGEEKYRTLAQDNPEIWLGEKTEEAQQVMSAT